MRGAIGLYNRGRAATDWSQRFMESFGLAMLAIGLAACLAWLLLGDVVAQARTERRRRRNHGPVVSRGRRPMVMLSVTTP